MVFSFPQDLVLIDSKSLSIVLILALLGGRPEP